MKKTIGTFLAIMAGFIVMINPIIALITFAIAFYLVFNKHFENPERNPIATLHPFYPGLVTYQGNERWSFTYYDANHDEFKSNHLYFSFEDADVGMTEYIRSNSNVVPLTVFTSQREDQTTQKDRRRNRKSGR